VLRTELLGSLVEAVRRNLDLGAEDIALFETARVYFPAPELPEEHWHVAGIVEGGWSRAKGIVETLYAALKALPRFERTEHHLLHPGKAASIGEASFVGELHPAVIDRVWGAFELHLDDLEAAAETDVRFADVITYPAVLQDLAFAVPEEVTAGELVAAAHEAAGEELREMRAFDVYHGDQVGTGRKSIAFSVVFQSTERTLSDEDAAALREKIVGALSERYGAELRA
jgi:phenylalanyl-tRNA synthetase beta chain